jgi:two-component system, chemotaxis family, CheB/CheR fusion protein
VNTTQEPQDQQPTQSESLHRSNRDLPVVGIAGSAGGLSAFKLLLRHLPPTTGGAFVFVPHLDPTHPSRLVSILARETRMPVMEVVDGMRIEPNCVYVIPPNRTMSLERDHFQLSVPNFRHGFPTAIDAFFASIAAEYGVTSIGIILSGTSNHGSVGLLEIKKAGGSVFAQQPETAQFDSMPRNAIATGSVDYVLDPEALSSKLSRWIEHLMENVTPNPNAELLIPVNDRNRILELVQQSTQNDFRLYRETMVNRRILRRMQLCHCPSIAKYTALLESSPKERINLSNDFLIGVTAFFRDTEAFRELRRLVIAPLVERAQRKVAQAQDNTDPLPPPAVKIRVWVPGCSTGEEAYSLAILFLEELGQEQLSMQLQMFATDLDEHAIAEARRGVYSQERVAAIPEELRVAYFICNSPEEWQVRPALRERITFATHDLNNDPPFSNIDLISCRNVLIYLQPRLQNRLIRQLHLALAPGGFVFLGSSDAVGQYEHLFETVDKRTCIHRKIPATISENSGHRSLTPKANLSTEFQERLGTPRREANSATPNRKSLLQRLVLAEYVPAAALVNDRFEILSLVGPWINYLDFPTGSMTENLLEMARPGLRFKLREAIEKVFATGLAIEPISTLLHRNGAYVPCTISAKPAISGINAFDDVLVVVSESTSKIQGDDPPLSISSETTGQTDARTVHHLDQELKTTQDELRYTIEDYQNSTEELKASGEEMMSVNEELQSANEELESSKEELQSLNEELNMVNLQLQEKVEELDRANSDIENLLTSGELSAIVLDSQLRIKRFTPSIAPLLSLRPSDIERPLTDFSPKVADEFLFTDCRDVLHRETPIERTVWTHQPSERCYLRRITPYRISESVIQGVVVSYFEITQQFIAETQKRRLGDILKNSRDAITLQDFEGRILEWNHGAELMYGYSENEARNMNSFEIIPEEKRNEAKAYCERLKNDQPVPNLETQRFTKQGDRLNVELALTPSRDERNRIIGFATIERDVTERSIAAKKLNESSEKVRAILDSTVDAIVIIDALGTIQSINPATRKMFEYTDAELLGLNMSMLFASAGRKQLNKQLAGFVQSSAPRIVGQLRELTACRKNGTYFPVDLTVSRIDHLGIFTGVIRDISAHLHLQKQVLDIAEMEQRRIGQELHDGTGQELTGLSLFASTLVDLLDANPEPATPGVASWTVDPPKLEMIRRTALRLSTGIADAHEHVQQLSHGILPVQIEPDGLVSALKELTRSTNELQVTDCEFDCPAPVLIEDATMASHLYRIAQESVNNAIKHGQPQKVRISLHQDETSIVLEIADDGCGFELPNENDQPTDHDARGYGLDIMKYRAGMIGGILVVNSSVGGGVSVVCSILRNQGNAS